MVRKVPNHQELLEQRPDQINIRHRRTPISEIAAITDIAEEHQSFLIFYSFNPRVASKLEGLEGYRGLYHAISFMLKKTDPVLRILSTDY